jgi:hypothetical protein
MKGIAPYFVPKNKPPVINATKIDIKTNIIKNLIGNFPLGGKDLCIEEG